MSSATGVMPAPVWVTPLLRRRASEEAHDQLRSKILTGELPAGTRLFEGATVSDTLAAVLKTEPAWNALAPAVAGE